MQGTLEKYKQCFACCGTEAEVRRSDFPVNFRPVPAARGARPRNPLHAGLASYLHGVGLRGDPFRGKGVSCQSGGIHCNPPARGNVRSTSPDGSKSPSASARAPTAIWS